MKLILKGIIIGIGKIIPGVSGSVLAISLGVYESSISCITNFFKDIKYNIKYLGLLGVGIIISITCLSKIIVYCLDNYYIYTMFLFIGLIVGSSNLKLKNKKYNYISLITFSLVLAFGLISQNNQIVFSSSIIKFIYMIFIGIVEAATMIIPGISGTAVLMMLGVYDLILNTYSSILNVSNIVNNLSILLPLLIGLIVGIYFTSKLINYLFKKYKQQTYAAIKGFLYGTIIYMIILCLKNFIYLNELFIGFIISILSYLIIKKINHYL